MEMIKEYPFVSIINPVRNGARTLEKNLETLIGLDYPKDRMEIIFADGGSTDDTVSIIKNWQKIHPFIKLVEVKNCKSPGQARNEALKISKGDYILFTDADCAVRKDWVLELLKPFFRDENIGMVGGEILTLRTEENNDVEIYCEQTGFLKVKGRCRVEEGYYPKIEKDLPHEVNGNIHSPFFATANACVSKKALDSIGREFWHEITNEDVDFSIRILKSGFKLYFSPRAIVEHMHRLTLKDYCKQLYGYGFGHPLPVKVHAKNFLEICFQYFGYIYIPIPFFKKGMIYIGDFHLMHLFFIISFIQLIISFIKQDFLNFGLLFCLLLFFLFTFRYFGKLLFLRPKRKFFSFCKIRYISNWALMRGGGKGARTWGILYLESSW